MREICLKHVSSNVRLLECKLLLGVSEGANFGDVLESRGVRVVIIDLRTQVYRFPKREIGPTTLGRLVPSESADFRVIGLTFTGFELIGLHWRRFAIIEMKDLQVLLLDCALRPLSGTRIPFVALLASTVRDIGIPLESRGLELSDMVV